MRELTPKQDMFVKEYLIDLNATQAAIRAGYSEKTAHVIANQLLNKTLVSDAIKKARQEQSKRTLITADDVIQSIIDIRQMAINSDKLSDALKANELLGKHLVLFTDKLQSEVQVKIKELPAKIDEFL
jgi:phage terminase small subunit